MEFTSDVINFTKIKDGFFLGDESIASNLEVLLQFKISHIINAAGAQVINAWESIGIRYLTLNWSESPNQILFDQKDEIANKIVEFADEALKSGEGLLVHSLKGQNRACIVVMIYLMKKHRWTLAKAMEFINNKKYDIEIQKHFLNQLFLFEARLNKTGFGAKSATFSEISNENDHEEILLRNTYLNGLENKLNNRPLTANADFSSYSSKKIFWADKNDSSRKDLLCTVNPQKELYFIKEIRPVTNHKKMMPLKSSFKRRSANETAFGSGAGAKADRSPYADRGRELQSLLAFNNANSKNAVVGNFNNGFVPVKGNYNSVNSNSNNNSTSLNSSNNLSDNNRDGFGYNKTAKLGNDLNANSNHVGQNYNPNNYGIGKNHQGIGSTNTSNDYSTSSYLNNQQPQKQINTSSVSSSKSILNNNNNNNVNTNTSLSLKRGEASNYSNKENRNNITPPNANYRSFSYDQKNENNNKNNFGNNDQKKEVTKIIISPQIQNVINQNINNIYIQNNDMINKNNNSNNSFGNSKNVNYGTGDKVRIVNSSSSKNNISSLNNNVNSVKYNSLDKRNISSNNLWYNSNQGYNPLNRPNSVGKKDNNNNSLNNLYQQPKIDNSRSQVINSNVGIGNYKEKDFGFNVYNDKMLNRSLETQKIMQNNYFNNQNALENKQFKIIDYNTGLSQNANKKSNKNSFNQNVSANNASPGQSYNISTGLNYNKNTGGHAYQGVSLNNYQPELNKKNIGNANQPNIAASLLNRPNSQMMKQGPVKIQNEYDRKPSTPDVSYNKYNSNPNSNNLSVLRQNNNTSSLSNKHYSSNQSSSVVKRSNSYKKSENNDRPSTAPQKNDKEERTHLSQLNVKRLPSPNLKGSSNGLGNSYKPSISSNFGLSSNPVYSTKGGLGPKLSGTLGNNQGKSLANKLKKK